MQQKIMDIMRRGVVTCPVDATVAQVAQRMLDDDVSAVAVIDERLDLCGVVTRTDLIRCYGDDLDKITAEDIMSTGLCTASPETPVHQAVEQMLARKIHQLVIVSQGGTHRRPVGIFTRSDALAAMAGRPVPSAGT